MTFIIDMYFLKEIIHPKMKIINSFVISCDLGMDSQKNYLNILSTPNSTSSCYTCYLIFQMHHLKMKMELKVRKHFKFYYILFICSWFTHSQDIMKYLVPFLTAECRIYHFRITFINIKRKIQYVTLS